MGKKILNLEKTKIAKLDNLIEIKGGKLLASMTDSIVFTCRIGLERLSIKTRPIGLTGTCK